MRKRRKLWLIFAAAGLCGCRDTAELGTLMEEESRKEPEMTLSVFYSGENAVWTAAVEELCQKFMNEYPQITVNMEYSDSGDYLEELKAKEAVGEFPDLFEAENLSTLKEAKKLGSFDEELGEQVEDPVRIEGKIYALPFYRTSYGIVYNQILFKRYGLEPPETYDGFLEICSALKEQGVAPLAAGGSEKSVECGWLNYFLLTGMQQEANTWQEQRSQGRVSFQDPEIVQALEALEALMTGAYVLEDSFSMGDNQIIANMMSQEAAMYLGTPAMMSKIWDAYPLAVDSGKTPLGEELENDNAKMRLGWFYMPDASGQSVVMEKTGYAWAISKECAEDKKKKEAANKFLEFCYEKENYREAVQAMNGIPVTRDAILYAAPAVQQGVLKSYRYAERQEEFLGGVGTPECFQERLEALISSLARGDVSAGETAELLEQAWEEAGKEP